MFALDTIPLENLKCDDVVCFRSLPNLKGKIQFVKVEGTKRTVGIAWDNVPHLTYVYESAKAINTIGWIERPGEAVTTADLFTHRLLRYLVELDLVFEVIRLEADDYKNWNIAFHKEGYAIDPLQAVKITDRGVYPYRTWHETASYNGSEFYPEGVQNDRHNH